MKRSKVDAVAQDETPRDGESFLQRFNRRKIEARDRVDRSAPVVAEPTGDADMSGQPPDDESAAEQTSELTDADMPPLESLDESSDYSGFLSGKVSEGLRRAALRKLFHSSQFNVISELDEYAEDFTTFEALGDIVTADMRHQIEVEARKKAEALKQAMMDETTEDDADADLEASAADDAVVPTEQATEADLKRITEADDPGGERLTQASPIREEPHAD